MDLDAFHSSLPLPWTPTWNLDASTPPSLCPWTPPGPGRLPLLPPLPWTPPGRLPLLPPSAPGPPPGRLPLPPPSAPGPPPGRLPLPPSSAPGPPHGPGRLPPSAPGPPHGPGRLPPSAPGPPHGPGRLPPSAPGPPPGPGRLPLLPPSAPGPPPGPGTPSTPPSPLPLEPHLDAFHSSLPLPLDPHLEKEVVLKSEPPSPAFTLDLGSEEDVLDVLSPPLYSPLLPPQATFGVRRSQGGGEEAEEDGAEQDGGHSLPAEEGGVEQDLVSEECEELMKKNEALEESGGHQPGDQVPDGADGGGPAAPHQEQGSVKRGGVYRHRYNQRVPREMQSGKVPQPPQCTSAFPRFSEPPSQELQVQKGPRHPPPVPDVKLRACV
ncbi:hypothetical protein KUCAC02_034752 [Chaenocephalus aceratus]|nr:hypothetical protein KUCAC02_034752 [Chaenocephalus aceratus]